MNDRLRAYISNSSYWLLLTNGMQRMRLHFKFDKVAINPKKAYIQTNASCCSQARDMYLCFSNRAYKAQLENLQLNLFKEYQSLSKNAIDISIGER